VADGVIYVNQDGKIVLFNSAAEAIFGLRANDVIGKSLETVKEIEINAHEWMQAVSEWRSVYRNNQDNTVSYQFNSETGRAVDVKLSPVRMDDFIFRHCVSVSRHNTNSRCDAY
jgi:PAS domain S-box-containing protein